MKGSIRWVTQRGPSQGAWNAGMIHRLLASHPMLPSLPGSLAAQESSMSQGTGAPVMKVEKFRGLPQHLKVPKAGSTHGHSL